MKFLQSSWAAAIVGLLCYWLTTYVCWTKAAKTLIPPPPVKKETVEVVKGVGASWNFKNPEVALLIEDLRKQKEALNLREQQLKEFEVRLQTERVELNQITQHVGLMQSEFDRLVVEVKKEEVGNLKKMAKMYSSMSPDGAANILKERPDAELVKVLSVMKEAESGAILEALGKGSEADTKRAGQISDRLRLAITKNALAKPKAQ